MLLPPERFSQVEIAMLSCRILQDSVLMSAHTNSIYRWERDRDPSQTCTWYAVHLGSSCRRMRAKWSSFADHEAHIAFMSPASSTNHGVQMLRSRVVVARRTLHRESICHPLSVASSPHLMQRDMSHVLLCPLPFPSCGRSMRRQPATMTPKL